MISTSPKSGLERPCFRLNRPFVPAKAGTQRMKRRTGLPLPRERTEFASMQDDSALSAALARRADPDGGDRQERTAGHEEEHLLRPSMVEQLAEDDRRH